MMMVFLCGHQVLELLVQRDEEFQELMEVAHQQGKVHEEMQVLEKEVEKRDSDIQQLQKQLKEAEHILVGAVTLLCGSQLEDQNFISEFYFSHNYGNMSQSKMTKSSVPSR